jgi:D-alanyl-D-alanine carboxypeptidase
MKFNFLLVFSFVLITLVSLSLSRSTQNKYFQDAHYGGTSIGLGDGGERVKYVIVPVLKEDVSYPDLSARSVLVYDLGSRTVMYEKDPNTPFLPASTTKIVTALVALDTYSPDTILTVGDVSIEGQKMHLVLGERISVKNLLYGLLIASGNDAAEVLAQNYPQGREAFVDAMNMKAVELGLNSSYFNNPSGLDGSGHVTTAFDLIKASTVAMRESIFREIVGTKEVTVMSEDGQVSHRLVNINELLGEVEGVLGVKTGWTEEARENLVTYVERENKQIMIALLGSQDRFGETRELIEWLFDSFEWEEVKVAI